MCSRFALAFFPTRTRVLLARMPLVAHFFQLSHVQYELTFMLYFVALMSRVSRVLHF